MPDKITFSLKDIDPPQQPARDATGDVPFLPDAVNDAGKAWVKAGPTRVKEGLGELVRGDGWRGAHDVLAGTATTAAPMVAARVLPSLVAAPLRTMAQAGMAGAGATVGNLTADALAEYLGATEDQSAVAGDVGALIGGAAGLRAQRAIGDLAGRYGPAVKAIAVKAARLPAHVPAWMKREAISKALNWSGVPGPLASRAAGMVIRDTGPSQSAPAPMATPSPTTAPQPSAPARVTSGSTPVSGAPAPKDPSFAHGDPNAPAWLMEDAAPGQTRMMSPQAIRNAVSLAARRAGLKLDDTGYAEAERLVRAGRSPVEAAVAVTKAPATASSPATAGVSPVGAVPLREPVDFGVLSSRLGSTTKANAAIKAAIQEAAGKPLTPEEVQTAYMRVLELGESPARAAVDVWLGRGRALPVAQPPAAVSLAATPPPKIRATADEALEYGRLIEAGRTPKEAVETIMEMRRLLRLPGTVTPRQARGAVKERNETGRWGPRR